MSKYKGQSGSEYIVIGSLAAVISIAALASLGGTLDGSLISIGSQNNTHALNSLLTEAPAGLQATVAGAVPARNNVNNGIPTGVGAGSGAKTSAGNGVLPNGTGSTITLADGTTMNVGFYPVDTGLIETAGSHGTTELLMGQMDTMISQLEAEGKIDSTQANLLKNLSNQGHRIAEIEKVFETAFANSGGNSQALHNTPVVFDGVQYPSVDSLVAQNLGWHKSVGAGDYLTATNNTLPETKKFIDLYNEARASGAMNDPA
ncbi:MAG: hypothetical protein KTR14_00715, partial [Vampirovibrio sp.]|nr:hypothetical protein [Vampirovibrio sp.]